jgi:uroporphyrinogen-III decarboxylase
MDRIAGAMNDKASHPHYAERVKRMADQVALRETDHVPFVYASRFWAATYAGISFEEFMYDPDKAIDATRQVVELLEPDAYSHTIYAFGSALQELDFRPMKWPGHGADPNATFQYIDQEFMSAKEYDEFLLDPSGYYLKTYLPRLAGAFEALKLLPDVVSLSEWKFITGMRPFANPELQEGLKQLFKAGEANDAAIRKIGAFVGEMKEKGYPIANSSFCKSPYDHLVDSMRGSKGGMLDMFRNKEKLLAAIDKMEQFLVRGVEQEAKALDSPYIFMPLHWGLDGFMSPDQFKTFYWPSLRRIILYLIERDLVPVVFWEGNCTSRLEVIGDIPAGKAVYWFEATDLVHAKEVLGDTVCLRGNVPASLLITGTADDVDAYCRNLIEKVGKGGGFILDGAASIPDEAKTENVVAMARSVHKYAN